jgi:MerR family mercuric resistance operon transcriptional regulator
VKFVKSAQRLGFSLDEIAELLRLEDGTHCDEASRLAEHKLQDVRAKLADLARMEVVLVQARVRLPCTPRAMCPVR